MMGSELNTRLNARGGHTLVELVISMGAASVLLAGLASSLFIAGRMVDPSAPVQAVLDASQVAYHLTDELQYAIYFTERSSTMVQFAVADRDGDGQADVIRYEWSGTPGDSLVRTFNHGAPKTVVEDVQDFNLTYDIRQQAEEIPTLTESGESILSAYTGSGALKDFSIDQNEWIGQYFHPSDFSPPLPADAVNWRVTKVEFEAKERGGDSGRTWVQLRPATGNRKPTSTVLEEVVMLEDTLTSSYAWKSFSFSNVSRLSPNQGLCLVLEWINDNHSAKVRYDDSGGSGGVTTINAGASWAYLGGKSLRYRIYGKSATPDGTPHTVARNYLTGIGVTLRIGSDPKSRIDTGTSLLNSPELLSAFWKLDFDLDPTGVDANFDGSGDWVRRDGQPFLANTLVNGVWRADATLDTSPANDFAGLTTIEVRFRNTSIGGEGAVFSINADWSGGTTATTIYASLMLQADGTQTLIVYQKADDSTSFPLVTVPGLEGGFVDLRLVIDPPADLVALWVDSVFEGTYGYTSYSRLQDDRLASLFSDGSDAEFDYVSIRVSDNN